MCIKFMIISDLCMLISTIYICIIQKQNNVFLFCVFYEKVCISISCYMCMNLV